MSKKEFLEKLRQALNGKVSPSVVDENINYYDDYINVEIRKGRTEEEVMNELGDPRLIAKTIVGTSGSSGQNGYYDQFVGENTHYDGRRRSFRIPSWVVILIVIVVLMLVLSVVFSVMSFLLPVLIPIIAVVFLVKLFRDWLN